ncbi:MAG: type II toxin-antitoxin system VapC family toxin [Candidatus Tectomicrobia bacterium]|uniref:Type II toxin-antitoxin system VapC family toxin n=1 Tax=Tectimicrobiota bacterium TaxID=2528274 RepID=A0A937W3T5_UNCTE|nr:type II toxin-antitoxin system VapC family toxin [Candidatus Tectomicrobia bacterium]
MKGLDTNVIVRYLTQDDPVQAQKATQVIEEGVDQGEAFYLTSIVVCELVWVLESAYDYTRHDIQTVLDRIFRTAQFRFEHKDQLWLALHDYRAGKADFSDYLIGRLSMQMDCTETLTFDTSLRASPQFRLL